MRIVTLLFLFLILILTNNVLFAQAKSQCSKQKVTTSTRDVSNEKAFAKNTADKPYPQAIVLQNKEQYQSAKEKLAVMKEAGCCEKRAEQLKMAIQQYETATERATLLHRPDDKQTKFAKAQPINKAKQKYTPEKQAAAQEKLAELQKKGGSQKEQQELKEFISKCKAVLSSE